MILRLKPPKTSLLRESAAAFAVFSGITLILYRDVVSAPAGLLLAGDQVGAYFSWIYWYWGHALQNNLPLFFTTYLMFPEGVPLFSVSPIIDAAGVLIQAAAGPGPAVNLLLLLTYAVNGTAAFALCRRITGAFVPSICGGFIFAFSAVALTEHLHGHVQETMLAFIPLLALALLDHHEKPSTRGALYCGAALLGTALSSTYVAFSALLFIGMASAYAAVKKPKDYFQRYASIPFISAVAGAGIISVIAYWPVLKWSGQWRGGETFYPSYLFSVFTPPVWNTHGFIQWLQSGFRARTYFESSMCYFGFAAWLIVIFGVWRGLLKAGAARFWIWLLAGSILLALGPSLELTPNSQTGIPLPYAVFTWLPVLREFRVPGRIMSVATLAAAVLVALSLKILLRGTSRIVNASIAAAIMLFTLWELDAPRAARQYSAFAPPEIYRIIADDAAEGAVLELPIYFMPNGEIMFHSARYMRYAAYHHKPLVIGGPSRFLKSNRAFSENTDAVMELTHPAVLMKLDSDPALKTRARWLEKNGAAVLAKQGIKYVVFHESLGTYPEAVRASLRSWVKKMFGAPIAEDLEGNRLYITKK